jgi:hypothetical protein
MPLITNKLLVNGIEPAPVLTQEHLAAIAAVRPIAGQELPPAPYVEKPNPVIDSTDIRHTVRNAPLKSSKYMQDIVNYK